MKTRLSARDLTVGALFVALGIIIPLFFHLVGLGSAFLPMHLPVLLGGFLCGPLVGLLVGAVTPLLSSLATGMPPLMPVAVMMVFELGVYGLLAGWLYRSLRLGVVPALVLAIAAGRLVYGVLGYFLLPLIGLGQVPLLAPLAWAVGQSLPGVVIQLVGIPVVLSLIERNAAILFVGRRPARREVDQ